MKPALITVLPVKVLPVASVRVPPPVFVMPAEADPSAITVVIMRLPPVATLIVPLPLRAMLKFAVPPFCGWIVTVPLVALLVIDQPLSKVRTRAVPPPLPSKKVFVALKLLLKVILAAAIAALKVPLVGTFATMELSIMTTSPLTGTPSTFQFAAVPQAVPFPLVPPSHFFVAAKDSCIVTEMIPIMKRACFTSLERYFSLGFKTKFAPGQRLKSFAEQVGNLL